MRASPPDAATRELGGTIARRIACAPAPPGSLRAQPARARLRLPARQARAGAGSGPVAAAGSAAAAAAGRLPPLPAGELRRAWRPREGLTASLRRVTAFTSVEDLRPAGGPVRVSYWLYRPTLGWERLVREAGADEIAAAGSIRLDLDDVPALVPLETLPGRNHFRFPASEEPPWRWAVPTRYPG